MVEGKRMRARFCRSPQGRTLPRATTRRYVHDLEPHKALRKDRVQSSGGFERLTAASQELSPGRVQRSEAREGGGWRKREDDTETRKMDERTERDHGGRWTMVKRASGRFRSRHPC
ncbi:hypothetical protein M407DRAFT_153522 [Tulasnella calospora MUT 4182]|uniref:Uncharacterized protein n=1 Tax=Tulasnella calospora MUT 4182 TaxID=1051891 RepID=A0A0C3Q5N7_9AGAM|nr:hypothetical protein M407DRAFT_153522 [Tulasnella calospora MUT 4182]